MSTYKLKRKRPDGTLEDVILQGAGGGGSGDIIDIPDQYVRITDLDSGVYKLTYEGYKYIYYSGTTGTQTASYSFVNPFILNVTKKQNTKDSAAYWDWYTLCYTSGLANGNPILTYGMTTVSRGSRNSKNFGLLLEGIASYVKDNLTYNTSGSSYALSAYQGYVLDQRLQAVEQGGAGGDSSPFTTEESNYSLVVGEEIDLEVYATDYLPQHIEIYVYQDVGNDQPLNLQLYNQAGDTIDIPYTYGGEYSIIAKPNASNFDIYIRRANGSMTYLDSMCMEYIYLNSPSALDGVSHDTEIIVKYCWLNTIV